MLQFIKRLFPNRPAKPPALDQGPVAGVQRIEHCLRIEYGDWGYAELVHQNHLAAVKKEMRAISAIGKGQDTTYGWTDFHLRDEIDEPLLPAEIPLKALHDIFPRRMDFKGVDFWGGGYEAAERSFAFSTVGGLAIYGEHYPGSGDEQLRSICFDTCKTRDRGAPLSAELEALAQFAAWQQLYLICWNKEFCSQPDAGRYLKFFEQYK